jgi:hypothetical protein
MNWHTPKEKMPQTRIEVLVVSELDVYYIAKRYNNSYFKTREDSIVPIKYWCYLPKISSKKNNCRKRKKCLDPKKKES